MIDFKTYKALDRVLKKLERIKDEHCGAYKQIEKGLKKEHGCTTVEEAEKLWQKYKRDNERKEKVFIRKLRRFFKQNPQVIKQLAGQDIELLRSVAFPKKATKKRTTRREQTWQQD